MKSSLRQEAAAGTARLRKDRASWLNGIWGAVMCQWKQRNETTALRSLSNRRSTLSSKCAKMAAMKNRVIATRKSRVEDQGKEDDLIGITPGDRMGMVWPLTLSA